MRPRLRRALRRQRTRANRLLRIPPDPNTRVMRQRGPADPLPSFTLWAMLGTFMEGDVVGATVANLFTQGCERVFLLDNDSPDDTVEAATAAGAELIERYGTDGAYDDHVRTRKGNDWMARLAREAPEPHVWWLYVDADEFPHGTGGRTVRDQLASLDRQYRVVGARFWNHFPTPGAPVAYRRGHHPLDDQPLVEVEPFRYCRKGHYKHPLLRLDAGRPPLALRTGAHVPERECGHRLAEPPEGIEVHHLQFRAEEDTRARMAVVAQRLIRPEPIAERMAAIDAVYRGDWDAARLHRGRLGNRGVRPAPWPLPDDIARWDPAAAGAAR